MFYFARGGTINACNGHTGEGRAWPAPYQAQSSSPECLTQGHVRLTATINKCRTMDFVSDSLFAGRVTSVSLCLLFITHLVLACVLEKRKTGYSQNCNPSLYFGGQYRT